MSMSGRLKLVTAPAVPLITTADAKLFLRVDGSDEDTLIAALVATATDSLETLTNRKFISQTWDYWLDGFPSEYKKDEWWDGVRDGAINMLYATGNTIKISLGPVSSYSFLKTYGDDDSEETFAASNYSGDVVGPRGRVSLKQGAIWPSRILRPINGIQVRFVVGYGAASTNVPSPLITAVKEYLASLYEHRGDENPPMSKTVMALARPFRVENL